MSRYIDISELEIPSDECSYEELETFVETVCESEYIDIVRCSECKYFEPKEDWCYWRDEMITADGFCSYGVNSSEKPNNSKERSGE